MTAGRGITHSERFERARAAGGAMHGMQAWVALPQEHEETEPAFLHYGREVLPVLDSKGVWSRLIAGAAFGSRSPVKTHSPMFYVHSVLEPRAVIELPAEYPERAAYVVTGTVEAGGEALRAGQMRVFAPGKASPIVATAPATVMLLGGEPVGERHIEWNFVSSSKERIVQAKTDWRAGRMKLPDLDSAEFIPLPGSAPPENPTS